MIKKTDMLPEVFLSDSGASTAVGRMVRSGTARKIGPRLYTRNMQDEAEEIVVRNLWTIVALLAPGTVVSHRTAFENRPAPDGSVFLSAAYPRRIDLPGVTIRQISGSGPVDGDMPYMGSLYLASRPRAYLENLLPSRRREKAAKTVGQEDVERRLAETLQIGGENALNRLRDEARSVAPALRLAEQFHVLDGLISAMLRSRPAALQSPVARAYAAGEPYDPRRLPLFDTLFAALRARGAADRPDRAARPPAFQNAAFFDAYFSNYIEGTDFPVEQAVRIVLKGEIPSNRPADAHDVLATYRVVADGDEMRQIPSDFDGFEALLRHRHAVMMEARPEKLPGQFKEIANQAGATVFVDPPLVRGTLRKGFELYRAMVEPFARALFMMFLVAEVHPFTDGNGRMARAMMNAELVAGGQTRIVIPAVFRNEYIGSLKRLTNQSDPDGYIRVMDQAQSFFSQIDFTDLDAARRVLAACNAFKDPADDVKLRMPPGVA